MTLFLLSLLFSIPNPADQVHTVRVSSGPGTIELCTAVAISPSHAVALCLFSPDNEVSVETPDGIVFPESLTVSPDLGILVMHFAEEVFEDYSMPSDIVPDNGETVSIIGQGLNGMIQVQGRAVEQYPDGSFLISTELREGLMGAAVYNNRGDYIGLITGMVRPSRQFSSEDDRDYLVLYPSQIWYMWAKLVVLDMEDSHHSFGVTALSSISLTPTSSSGIQVVSVSVGSLAWESGLRPGDLITHINGTPVYHPETLRGLLILSEDTLQATVQRSSFQRNLLIPPFD